MTDQPLHDLDDPSVALRRALAIADEVNWGGDLRTDARARSCHDAAVACMVEALATAHLDETAFVVERARKRLADKLAWIRAGGTSCTAAELAAMRSPADLPERKPNEP